MSNRHIRSGDDVFDVVTIGETLAAFIRDGDPRRYRVTAVGAESNLAVAMTQVGCRARWATRLGEDELGRMVYDCIAGHGVDLQVEWDDCHPTGICVKEIGPEQTRVRYYRGQSAARQLGAPHVADLGRARWVHLTGITPALSASAAELVSAVLERRVGHAGRVSFDVNYRPALWLDADTAADVLVPLARLADVVFVGDDEAKVLLGTSEVDALAATLLVRDDQELVLKRGAGEASVITRSGCVSARALKAAVVDLTGAGDAFAGGYLAASCWGWEAGARLRLGHILAARVVGVTGDLGPELRREEVTGLTSIIQSLVDEPTEVGGVG